MRNMKEQGISLHIWMLFHPISSSDISLFFHEGKVSLNCITGPGTPWLTPSFSPIVPARPLSQTGQWCRQALVREVEEGKDLGTRLEEGIWKGILVWIGERRCRPTPRPQTSASVPVKPSLPLKLFLSDRFSPVCSEACLPGVAGWNRLAAPSALSVFQDAALTRLIFLCFLSCFHCRELCGVSETECEQPQLRVPAECHLPRHGVLGVSGNTLSPLAGGGSVLVLLSYRGPHLQPQTPWLLWASDCFGSYSGDLERFPKGAPERNASLFFDDMSTCLVTYWGKKCLVKWWAV